MGVSGTGDHDQPLYTHVSRTRADLQDAADYARKVGNRRADTSSTRTAATAAGKVWDGLEWFETDTAITWIRTNGQWAIQFAQGGFASDIGNGGSRGDNGGSNGSYVRRGKHITCNGRILFGSSAVWGNGQAGSGAATVNNLPASIDTTQSIGYGSFRPYGGTPVPVQFSPHPDGAQLYIEPLWGYSDALVRARPAYLIGTIPQSSELRIHLDLVAA